MCPCTVFSKQHLTCCIKWQQVFILWHLNTNPAREEEEVGASWRPETEKSGRLRPPPHPPPQPCTSEIIRTTFTAPANMPLTLGIRGIAVFSRGYLAHYSRLPVRPAESFQRCPQHLYCRSHLLCQTRFWDGAARGDSVLPTSVMTLQRLSKEQLILAALPRTRA